ncbi:hypothetical protein FACS189431_7640 [Alphaproteobacteria bacterium]|nr:hypothetical protein FACS189431_7640 [Alphaproteobacteria bacterium]
MTNRRSNTCKIVGIVIPLLLFLGLWAIFANRQYLLDYARYSAYTPSAEIEQLVARAGFTDDGKFRAYSAEPSLEGATEFNQHCDAAAVEVNVLGCYADDYIYIYKVENKELDGIEEVTLAHEMLHAAYARLDSSERSEIDALLDSYAKEHGDNSLKGHMENYPPEDRYTELHSVIGTEYSGLPSELETHYAKYYDRAKVLALYDGYQQKFDEIEARADEIIKEGEALAADITSQSESYAASLDELNAKIANFNRRAESGAFTSQTQFDYERAGLLAESSRLDALREEINQKIDRYNALRDELQQLETRNKELNDSINSKLDAAPSL